MTLVRDACRSGRSCYVFHVGRVNEAKLGNFPEVACAFVAVMRACTQVWRKCVESLLPQVGAFCVIAAAEHSLFRSLALPAPVIRCQRPPLAHKCV